eukprot:9443376-Pyramimonas_sp.AAC.1
MQVRQQRGRHRRASDSGGSVRGLSPHALMRKRLACLGRVVRRGPPELRALLARRADRSPLPWAKPCEEPTVFGAWPPCVLQSQILTGTSGPGCNRRLRASPAVA